MAREEVVSSANEQLILVDDQDRELGFKSKGDCHAGKGVLHRAFSIFVFNGDNELLLQQRSPTKLLWPNYWSNTCCSHPRRGESMDDAVTRRLVQELGFDCPLEFLYKFKYQAQFGTRRRRARVLLGLLRPLRRPRRRERERDRQLAVHRRRRRSSASSPGRRKPSRRGSRWNGCTSGPTT